MTKVTRQYTHPLAIVVYCFCDRFKRIQCEHEESSTTQRRHEQVQTSDLRIQRIFRRLGYEASWMLVE
jgi:hypothetical protein